ncbi:hypothetical protein [Microbacterium azadirachtae]|uniref:Integral membrane protein n=1 Tax=Microbacterium azadirachtae TaxID=582680 RepID=A0A1I6G918_9MICO|nr:hypothetical protein [Microbacterium azadirachtae]SDL37845.1 hypothetical protein SAMN04488593_0896 [Microbacterium azadirachtae]SEF68840.1 hypothetical protein SAMN04488594_0885 [Microbacterium azadirachtae]SEF69504.1 hypothetical protein SAMN04488592_0894 [Microbacterium azadirachtae]SFR38684.1 hypothetical protein SAMN04488591_0898 [Microbacterium azadirachtae]
MGDRVSSAPGRDIRPGWLTALRAVIILQTVCVFAASVTAGLQLTDPALHPLHSATSYTLFTVVILALTIAILAWRPGGGSPRPMLYAALFLAGTLAQIILGLTGIRFAHVPLGVLLFGATTLQLAWIYRTPRNSTRPAAHWDRARPPD